MENEQIVNTEATVAADAEVKENREPREQRSDRASFRNKRRKKVCAFCADKVDYIDYKDVRRFSKNLSERAKILPRRVTGTCARHQRQLTIAVKRARHLALIPYITD
ncbi:MAG: 30S ribosomal protein S18 [Ruminococcaceae bacterium]|nr:30S ribosomal protein S18 [Oscillospiraceae bacterium]